MGLFGKKNKLTKPTPKAKAIPCKTKGFRKYQVSTKEFDDFFKTGKVITAPIDMAIPDRGAVLKPLIQIISRYYPTASHAIWVWKNLTSTKQKVSLTGNSDASKNMAKTRINLLDKRVSPFKHVKGGGMDYLISLFFLYIFKYGRFAGRLIIDANLKMVKTFQILDPYRIKFSKNNYKPYYLNNSNQYIALNENSFFYYALNADVDNPYGEAMIEASYSLMQIAEDMLEDMRLSSSNAGIPRLHIKIEQPEKLETEDDEDYVERISSYFDSYVDQFAEIGPDDNFYSWSDVTIGSVGGNSNSNNFLWRSNRLVLDEEIISGFHLYNWIMGKSAQTTKNWVNSQFDLLLAQIVSLQQVGKRFAEWIRNVDLKLGGITDVVAHHMFELPRDPNRKDIAIAERFEIQNADTKVRRGVISPDDGARELGYDKAEDPELWLKGTDDDEDLNHKDDSYDDNVQDKLESIDLKLDTIIEGYNAETNTSSNV